MAQSNVPSTSKPKSSVPSTSKPKSNVPDSRKTIKIDSSAKKDDLKGRPSKDFPQPGTKIDAKKNADGGLKKPLKTIESRKANTARGR